MAAQRDERGWLPEPPPPRPPRRDAAIEAALGRFDGVEEASPAASARPSWASTHRPQLAMAASVALVALVGIPAGLVGLRNQPKQERPASFEIAHLNGPPAALRAPSAPAAHPAPPPARRYEGADGGIAAENKPSAPATDRVTASPAPGDSAQLAEEASAPPPPAAPPAPQVASNEPPAMPGSQNIIVTGSRIPPPNSPAAKARSERDEKAFAADQVAPDLGYGHVLDRLQQAFRRGDRGEVIALIAFPLRVNARDGSRLYRDARSVEQNYEQIFTPKVRRAVLAQRADRLFVRDQGAMIGDGEVWFDAAGIHAVNP